ncbi:MAG: hypothetical protein J6A96_00840 [Clostridia bacterium]|nr:hypothetical protein [Clostridia bacterium]
MELFQISEEAKNRILLYSAQALPDRPSSSGMTPSAIKGYFYKFIDKMIEAINIELANIVNGSSTDLGAHNQANTSHPYILKWLNELTSKDTQLGNAITNKISAHNTSATAHEYLRKQITIAQSRADDAYNLAQGKSKVHPYETLGTLLSEIDTSALTLHPGDMVVFKNENVPDLAVFKTGQEAMPEGDEEISSDSVLEEKKSYYYSGITFVALESGIDTSLLAKAKDIELMKVQLEGKEEAIFKVESTASEIMLENHTEYNFGITTELAIALPEDITSLEVIINFHSSTTPTSFDAPSEILFQGDDTLDGRLYPVSNRLYEINIKNVMGVLVAKVGANDYEVIE